MTICTRSAWLTLNGNSVPLEDAGAGYFCTQLDLGYPAVREVVANKPDMDGVTDRTLLMGSRVVTADITTLVGAGARIDDVASMFAPFMVPSARPQLHYVLDRAGTAERVMTVRASGYSWPIAGPDQRNIHLAWVAADPIARDPNQQSQVSYAGTDVTSGRTYPLSFNRVYPVAGMAPSPASIYTNGDVGVLPLVRIYGPITTPTLAFTHSDGSTDHFNFDTGTEIAASDWIDVDAYAHTVTANSDPQQNMLAAVDWSTSQWPYIGPLPDTVTMQLDGETTNQNTQAVAYWNDGYLT